MSNIDAGFYDDSSTALGLAHSAKSDREAEIELLREAGITDVETVVPCNEGAHDLLQRLLDKGVPLREALDYIEQLPAEQDDQLERTDYMGDTTENLMRPGMTIVMGGGGGSKGRKRDSKKGKIGGGRPPIDDEPRSAAVGVRLMPERKAALESIAPVSELVNYVAAAILRGERVINLDALAVDKQQVDVTMPIEGAPTSTPILFNKTEAD